MDNVKNGGTVGMNLQVEQTNVKVKADIVVCDPELIQKQEDDALIPNVGDSRKLIRQGKIGSPDGETFIDTELTFIRTRNVRGGIDVKCIIPCLASSPQEG